MFFSKSINVEEVVETMRHQDPIKTCAQMMKEECKQYDFKLKRSYKSSQDLELSHNNFKEERLPSWETFFNELLPFREHSDAISTKV